MKPIKKNSRGSAILLTLLVLLMLLPAQAQAAGSIDLDRSVGLTISYQDNQTPLVGAAFDIYLVATVDEYGELTATAEFAQFNVNIRGKNDEAWRALASTLEGYVLRDQVAPADSGTTNDRGQVSFPSAGKSLTPGLYLVLGHRHMQNGYYYDTAPFLVMLPGLDKEANAWVYDVTVNAKFDSDPVLPQPSTVTRKVLKVWEDDGHEEQRPREVIAQLLRNGQVYDTVTLNAGNNWRHTWTGLDDSYQWNVVEIVPEGYTVEITREGITFVVTNTCAEDHPDEPQEPDGPDTPGGPDEPGEPDTPDEPAKPSEPDEPKLPQTGQLWWPVPVLLFAGMLLVVIGLMWRRGACDEE